MANINIENLTKRFTEKDGSKVVAVDDVSIDIRDGEFLILVGPSGCGKSTTLRCIAGLETPTSGKIKIGNDVLNEKLPQQRNIAMVFQSYALYPHMTVKENMRFGLTHSTDLPRAEADAKVEEVATTLGIHDLLERPPNDLSGGQQQRVALGRAIVRDPVAFLLDEPLSNLDAKLRAQMRVELQELQNQLGVTTIYVTHDQTEAMTMGDRIAVMNDGSLQQVGTPDELYYRPANQFVAGFIGEPSMNFFNVKRRGKTLETDGLVYELSDAVDDQLGDVEDLVMGVRPEDIELEPEATKPNDFESDISLVEPVGKEANVYLETLNDRVEFVAIVDGRFRQELEERVQTRIPEEVIHLFDTSSGEALFHGGSTE